MQSSHCSGCGSGLEFGCRNQQSNGEDYLGRHGIIQPWNTGEIVSLAFIPVFLPRLTMKSNGHTLWYVKLKTAGTNSSTSLMDQS